MSALVSLVSIKADAAAQPRASIFTDKVTEYAERMVLGDIFPPLVVFFDGRVHWLADGFHRYHAAIGAGLDDIACDIRNGASRDAILFSCGANATHGVPRTSEDKRRAVMKMLNDAEWVRWPQSDIARHCAVTREYVNRLSGELQPSCDRSQDGTRDVTRGGKTYTQTTTNIGKSSKDNEPPEEPPPPSPGLIQHQKDMANAFISGALMDIRDKLAALPPPNEAAERYPRQHRYVFTKASLLEMADWLSRFAEHYTEEGTNHVAA